MKKHRHKFNKLEFKKTNIKEPIVGLQEMFIQVNSLK